MLKPAVLAVLALTYPSHGGPDEVRPRCGTEAPSKQILDTSRALRAGEQGLNAEGQVSATEVVVNTHVHVVAKNKTAAEGWVPEKGVQDQMVTLNNDYRGAGIKFMLKSVNYVLNATWSNGTDEIRMRKTLRKGHYSELNLYLTKQPTGSPGVLGFCTFPDYAIEGTDVLAQDGCIVHVDTLPGGLIEKFNLGKTAVHEVGHWFGLLHTFQDGCDGAGDHVDDTPAQNSSTSGCPDGQNVDTCPQKPGPDPIHNYMDYSDDVCMREFTIGQINRIKSFWELLRRGT
ncbi:Peptidase M43, pregnancy-associated plasma-A [Metarhizium rileyi]|uniref:Peptidase M43, pregnancy-associated plasma-A n=1 Tax=Metarhizium rileyi (strain RCEF 4871) TaxID=1649241 RepID=A0A166ZGP9_METRR|nr:Peptidase M43, pregnancy-associated plasma-A [Metarhizium rileyi RCEF 4871]TWU74361.1 hypothetical protein ED733_006438 [Metarhizium rileyi]